MNFRMGLVVLAAVALSSASAAAQDAGFDPGVQVVNARLVQELAMARRAQALRTSAGADPDTVWFGYSHADHWSAGGNWWNLWTGVNRPGTGAANQAAWGWDDRAVLGAHGVNDSLQGWWPMRRAYTITGLMTLPDVSRAWWAIDIGNLANYVLPGGPGARTFGVVGVWHADAGVNQPGGSAVTWTPLAGTRSAWCGLRQLGDVSVLDPVTGSPFNQSTLDYLGSTTPSQPSRKDFPGYASQWDQMLYRDFVPPAGQALSLSFLYRTRMSTAANTAAATRTGWFHGDPLTVSAGNFISSTLAGANAPIDSFAVYVGVPVDDADCLCSDGLRRPVHDPQRRWFAEVLRVFDAPYVRVFAATGQQPADTASATPIAFVNVSAAQVDAMRDAPGNTGHGVRLVFRVKTNRGWADDDGLYDSGSRGAVLIDEVTVNGVVVGDFEGASPDDPNAIDNRTSASALDHWKSTGKPPSVYFHLENVTDGAVVYNDLCGAWDSPGRVCNLSGLVLTAGNHDDFERHGDARFQSDREAMHGAWSPTVNLVVDGGGAPNPQGITASIKDATDDYYLWYDVYAGMFNLQFTGNAWHFGAQAYPCRQAGNGAAVWGDPEYFSFQISNPEPQCFWDVQGLRSNGVLTADTPSGLPDSLRVFLGTNGQCFRFGVSLGCNTGDGAYFDNVSIGFVDQPGLEVTRASAAGAISVPGMRSDPWEWIADAFPFNETVGLPNSADFDTAAALVMGSANIAPATANLLRFDVLADTIVVKAPNVSGSIDPVYGNQTRVDLLFRILPGPGNYQRTGPAGARLFPPTSTMPLLRVPTDQAAMAAAGDGSFWGTYLQQPGPFAQGDHHGGAWWDYLTWNSARCDTAEYNVFPVAGKIASGLTAGTYANMLHEADPRYAVLGVSKFRCFVVDTTLAAEQANIVCDGTVPAWLNVIPRRRTGWDGTSTTKEMTKIIPDGLLTPGAHVQYFWRASPLADPALFVMCPDTNHVIQTVTEGSSDGHRWQQFGVLPDRWKDPAFGGAGMACMLYVDLADRRGTERSFVGLADSLCMTWPASWGAHNGWHAPAIYGGTEADLDAYPVHGRNRQPGTTWDLYNVKANESLSTPGATLGSRLANRTGMGLLTGRTARVGPTPEMLRKFYRLLVTFTGDLRSGVLGPYVNRSQDDAGLLNDFLTANSTGSTAQPRFLRAGGDGFALSEWWSGGIAPIHNTLLNTRFGVTLRNGSYAALSNNLADCYDLPLSSYLTYGGDVFGVSGGCSRPVSVLQRNPSVLEAVDAAWYENAGVNGPYTASVYKPATGTRNWSTYLEGFDLGRSFGRACVNLVGRKLYEYSVYMNLAASMCTVVGYLPYCPYTDVPGGGEPVRAERSVKIAGSVLASGTATVRLGVEQAQQVRVRLYDVAGRLVRTLADRRFTPGQHALVWDARDDAGRAVARGVYFARVDFERSGPQGRGRIVVLR